MKITTGVNYIGFEGRFWVKYLYVDNQDYVADSVFYRNEIPVHFGGEFVYKNDKYIVVTCRIRKKYKKKFEKALEEVRNKFLIIGRTDYEDWCKENFIVVIEYADKKIKNKDIEKWELEI